MASYLFLFRDKKKITIISKNIKIFNFLIKNQVSFLSKPIESGYQSHYVVTGKDGFPIKKATSDEEEYTEVVVPQEAQIISLYLM